jgi:hypothetical protein
MLQRVSVLEDYLDKRPKLRKMDMRFGTWNVRSLYSVGSLMTVAKEISKYKLNLVGGRAIAQAVSRRLPTAPARVQTWV